MSLLEVSHLCKSYGDHVAVADLDFQVAAGEIFGLLGPNGAGKSTTMMVIAGLLAADAGTVSLDGHTFDSASIKLRPLLGVVPQDLAIYPELTARENVTFFGRLYGLRGDELTGRIDYALSAVGLTQQADKLVETYSGGMKRRLNFAAAILHRPKLLMLDEPTVGVDPQSRAHLLDCVRTLCSEGVGIVYASHYMEEVQAICDRVGIMDHGRMLACGSLQELLGRLGAELRLHVSPAVNGLAERLRGLASVESSTAAGSTLLVTATQHDNGGPLNELLRRILEVLDEGGIQLASIESQPPNLERLFLDLTGHTLRD